MKATVRAHRHPHWTATGPDYYTPCPQRLWTVMFDGRETWTPTWAQAMTLANTLARAARPVEVLAKPLITDDVLAVALLDSGVIAAPSSRKAGAA